LLEKERVLSKSPAISKLRNAALGFLFMTVALVGCVSPQPLVLKDAIHNQNTGYITGVFFGKCQEYGFGIENTATKQTYFMSFFEPEISLRNLMGGLRTREEHASLIEVPPGTYRISYWASYESTTNGKGFTKPISSPQEFEVLPGKISVLGRYEVVQKLSYPQVEIIVYQRPVSKTRFEEIFTQAYPRLPVEALSF
jgi:hypothetical protein